MFGIENKQLKDGNKKWRNKESILLFWRNRLAVLFSQREISFRKDSMTKSSIDFFKRTPVFISTFSKRETRLKDIDEK